MARADGGVSPFRPWLPENAIADRIPTATLETLVERWSAAWFPSARGRLGRWTRAQGRDGDLVLTPEPPEPPGLPGPPELEALAHAMFGVPPEPVTAADRLALEATANACLKDLRRRLGELFGPAATPRTSDAGGPDAGRGCAIGLPGAPEALRLFLSDRLLAGWITATLPPAAPRAPMRPFWQALDPQTVGLSALVGRCRLSLGDLETWAVGDVLVLDRKLDAALDLVVGGRTRPDASCRLVDAGDDLHLVLN